MTERVSRVDRGEMRGVKRTPQGYLRIDAYATRTGVLEYRNPDGTTRRELRLPDEVARSDSLSTLALAPVTDTHPPEMLNAENTARYARGVTGERAAMDGDKVALTVTVMDAGLIADVEAGRKRELSCGYHCDLEMTPGEWKGQRYDAIQRNITYNHVAVVPRGRAGPEVRLRLDAAEEIVDDESDSSEEGTPVATKVNIDGVDYEVSEAVAAAITAKMRADAQSIKDANTAAEQAKADAKAATEKTDGLQAKLDAAEEEAKKRSDSAVEVPQLVKARLDLERAAMKVLPADAKVDELDDKALKAAVILEVYPEAKAKLDGASDAYIDARFDAAIEQAATRTDSTGKLRQAAEGSKEAARKDGEPRADSARQEMIKRNQDAWKQPLTQKGGN